jgi:7,8-dihydropterin-6-yl-methyl-4-(beta-D-ribofuranosyl)aminobenzene 5'-phosphate synthase
MKVRCLVDNAVLSGSRFWGEHGLAFLVETDAGSALFDTGQSGTVLVHNLEVAGVDPARISALALSHAHRDHTGGLSALLPNVGRIPLYAHPDLFRERFSRRQTQVESIGLTMTRDELQGRTELHLGLEPQEILPDVFTTGEILTRTEPEGRSEHHFELERGQLVPDHYGDDMSLVLQVPGGVVLLCGCCHAGLLNTLHHVRSTFQQPIVAVVGGTHLARPTEEQMHHMVQALRSYGTPRLYPNHCTGRPAQIALAVAFGDQVAPCVAGTELVF